MKKIKILAIETSCDETALAIIQAKGGFKNPHFHILKNLVASQVKIHAPFGGVVPNLAKRAHEKNLPILFKKLGSEYQILNAVDAIAVTVGPGLEPCLWQGIDFAKKLAKKHKKPVVAINHMEGHIASVLLTAKSRELKVKIEFPTVALLVSGGHTELILAKNWLDYQIIGQTLDDAAGEAFDKVARLLGLGYPGGPALSKLASKTKKLQTVNHKLQTIKFPRPMINSRDFNFSFSGLKTAVLYFVRKLSELTPEIKAQICREFQQAAIDVLIAKTLKAAQKYKPKTIILGGGVAANQELRKQIKKELSKKFPKISLLLPEIRFAGDNAAMIAAAGCLKTFKKRFVKNLNTLKADGNLKLG